MDFSEIEVKVNHPYPEIREAQDDAQTVAVLKNLAFSRVGEITGVLQYIYQSVIADKTKEEIAEIFEEIGVVEMLHLDMLMHAITEFGGNPKYEDAQSNYFNTSVVNYSMKLREMLDSNIRAESIAIENYNMAINKVKNQSLKDLFQRIIEDEQRHIEVFKQIRDSVEFMSV